MYERLGDKTPLINPTALFSDDPDTRTAEEAKWLLDPPTLAKQLEMVIAANIKKHLLQSKPLPFISAVLEEELTQRFLELHTRNAIYDFEVENTTTPDEIDRGIVSMRAIYRVDSSLSTSFYMVETKVDTTK
jgi:hypothetical protein